MRFTELEKAEVWDRWQGREAMRSIARRLGRSSSTVCREVTRNGGRGQYRAMRADRAAWRRSCRPKTAKLAVNTRLRAVAEDKLAQWWSPQQISGWLKEAYSGG